MTYITDTDLIAWTETDDREEDRREVQAYLDSVEDAAQAAISTEFRVLGSARLARMLGVNARLEREISG